MITSSPSPTPNHRSINSKPEVAEFKHKVALHPLYAVSFFSNNFVFGPVVIHPDFNVSITSSIILRSIRGGEKGIIILFVQKGVSYEISGMSVTVQMHVKI